MTSPEFSISTFLPSPENLLVVAKEAWKRKLQAPINLSVRMNNGSASPLQSLVYNLQTTLQPEKLQVIAFLCRQKT